MTYDLVTLGEAMLRLWVPAGERLEDAPAYQVGVAGSEANVAMATARAGLSVAWLSRLPQSALGKRAAREIAGHGVDVSHVVWDETRRMGTYFVELSVPPRPVSVVYDRSGSAASAMTPDDVSWAVVESARAVHLTGITPALSPEARLTTMETASRARRAGAAVIVDVNYRNRLWPPAEAAAVIGELCTMASTVIVTAEDARDLFEIGGPAPEVAAALRQTMGADAVIVTRGAEGAAWDATDEVGAAPGHPAEVIDRIGAGDAFAAGVIIGLLDGDIAAGVKRGLAMAALKVGIRGDQFVASQEEIETVLHGETKRQVSR
ncbi:MAG: bifunctional 2-dehydro-3-deoxygluconokinase/2-dehydro-3-deoxygalactonokinase [Acidimicrobiia bacterium]|nr:MAG: bifunctional 2-dehydro-3-deoxygluconokinase/2-dehydro-3-deoxygalactonokinase [Acidimicrobiia bacterium]